MKTSGRSANRNKETPWLGGRVAIVSSTWNSHITDRLRQGAEKTLLKFGIGDDLIEYFSVPGSFELPQALEALARTRRFKAIIPIGCLIRGETLHFDVIAYTVTHAIDKVARTHSIPISFGVLTCNTFEQALARSGGKDGNKGEDAADAAVRMAFFLDQTHEAKDA